MDSRLLDESINSRTRTLRPRKEKRYSIEPAVTGDTEKPRKRRGRKPTILVPADPAAAEADKKERNRVCAKQCRERKNLRYEYLEEYVDVTEQKVLMLRDELEQLNLWAAEVDSGQLPPDLLAYRAIVDGFDSKKSSRKKNKVVCSKKPRVRKNGRKLAVKRKSSEDEDTVKGAKRSSTTLDSDPNNPESPENADLTEYKNVEEMSSNEPGNNVFELKLDVYENDVAQEYEYSGTSGEFGTLVSYDYEYLSTMDVKPPTVEEFGSYLYLEEEAIAGGPFLMLPSYKDDGLSAWQAEEIHVDG